MVKGRSPDMRVHVNAQISHSIPTAINLTISHVYLPHYSVQFPMTFDEVRQRLIHDIHQLVSSSDMSDRIRMECLWPDATLRTTDDGLTVIPRNVVRLDQDHRAGQLNGLSIATALNERMNKLLATAVRDDPLLTSLSACVQVVVDRELTLMTQRLLRYDSAKRPERKHGPTGPSIQHLWTTGCCLLPHLPNKQWTRSAVLYRRMPADSGTSG